MKIFLDTANLAQIKQWIPTGLVDGVTTNPSLLSKEGANPKDVLLEICDLVSGPVSIEVVEKTPDAVYKQAHEIAKLAQNVVVKIPFTQEYLPTINKLTEEGIPLNITLIFSALQALIAAKLNVAMISPFIGRLDDIGITGIELIDEIIELKDTYEFDAQIIAASIRSVDHFKEAALSEADIITLPPAILEKSIKHPLTDKGIELFDRDWEKVGKKSLL